jgi:hypothetical protein
MEVLRRCQAQKVGPDGFRRSRWAVVRNTRPQLRDTTLNTWFDWVPPGQAGRWKESEMTFFLEFGDVKAEILFRPLDSPADIQRVLSLELTGVWINECREIPREIVEALQGRIDRYPSMSNGGASWTGIIADTNPPEVDSYWYKLMEGVPVEDDNEESVFNCESYVQPSGLAPNAENIENLRMGYQYYERMTSGRAQSWIDTYVHGEYSPSLQGVPVYAKSFVMSRHVSEAPLHVHPNLPIVVGMDFGRTPAAVFKQMLPTGNIVALDECVDFDVGLETFLNRKMIPKVRTRFPNNPLVIIGDPAGVRRNDTDEGTCFKMLKDAFSRDQGHRVRPASTNARDVRILATEKTLMNYPNGEPSIIFDKRCKWLIEALRSRYRYANVRNGDLNHQPTPEKNNWSHVAEANQYADLFLLSGKYDASDYVVVKNTGFDFFNQTTSAKNGPPSYIGY